MNFNPMGQSRESNDPPTPARTGIAGRVEAASKMHAPAPKGKGLVMMILGVVVLGALIWDFTGHGAASRAVNKGRRDDKQPVAPVKGGTGAATGSLQIAIVMGKGKLSMSAADAVERFQALAGEEREAFRAQVLIGLADPAGRVGPHAHEAFEVGARMVEGAGESSARPIRKLRRLAWGALAHNEAAPAAILFLKQLPDSGGAETMDALDEVILDAQRPLAVRVEAARARNKTDRPAALDKLAADTSTHPSLRDALK